MKRFRWNIGVLIVRLGYKLRGEVPQKKYNLFNKAKER